MTEWCKKTFSMKSFLKSSRKAGSKKYLGVTGSYLVEIIDQEPVIMELIRGTRFSFTPSDASRYSGTEKRMILKAFSDDALLILNTRQESTSNDLVELSVFINQSEVPSHILLNEAEKLASLRWSSATLIFRCTSKEEYASFAQAGWRTPDTTRVRTSFKKFIGPGRR